MADYRGIFVVAHCQNGMKKADIAAFEKSENFEKCSFQPQISIEKCSFLARFYIEKCSFSIQDTNNPINCVILRNKTQKMSREERNTVGYVVALISEFAAFFGIQPKQAYTYLKRFKGIEHLQEHYSVLHTLSFPDAVETMAEVCAHNGGQLK